MAPKNVESRSKELEPMNEAPHEEDIDHERVESTKDPIAKTRKRPVWIEKTLKEFEGHVGARGTFRESEKPKEYSGYTTLVCKIIESKQSSYGEVFEE